MRSIRFSTFGEPTDVLHLEEIEKPTPGKGEVLIRMLARPINPSDLLTVRGLYGSLPVLPATPGLEGAGVIESVGDDVQDLQIGQRVIPLGTSGTWQEYLVVKAAQLIPTPDSISDEIAAQFVVNPLSAWIMTVDELKVEKGQWLLQTAAGSTLGRIVLQIAKLRGFKTINVVRRREQADELKSLGADEVISTDTESVVDRVMEITRKARVLAAIDAVGGEVGGEAAGSLGRGGVMITYGSLAGEPIPVSVGDMVFRSTTLRGFWLGEWFRSTPPAKQRAVSTEVLGLMAQGQIVPPIEAKYDLADIISAVRHAEKPGRQGKVLLVG